MDESTLTPDQARALEAVKSGRNVFITGAGGVGKSYLFDFVEDWAITSGKNLVTCAPTGIAAVKIGGCTMHRALGISPTDTIEHMSNPKLGTSSPLRNCDILVIDEISMCRIDLFDYMTFCMYEVNNDRARRGEAPCQLVVMGDFCQLPPVMYGDDAIALATIYGEALNYGYCYGGESWNWWNFEVVERTTIMRQADKEFIDALNRCRVGDVTGLHWISEHSATEPDPGAIKMFSRNDEVYAENARCLASLDAELHTYEARVDGNIAKADMVVPTKLELKVGARVMLVINRGEKVNGSMGVVLECAPHVVTVCFDDGYVMEVKRHTWEKKAPKVERGRIVMEVVGEYTQIPLKLAYAVTIHKSQGQTFDHVVLDPSCWERGQLYTALSRLSSVEGLYLAYPMFDQYLIAPPFAMPGREDSVDSFYYTVGKLAVQGHEMVEAGESGEMDVLIQLYAVVSERIKSELGRL